MIDPPFFLDFPGAVKGAGFFCEMATLNTKQPKRPWVRERKPFSAIQEKDSNYAFYNSTAWRKYSKAFKMANPLCACGQPTHTTDHIKPINEGGAKWDYDNMQPLCKNCNFSKTGKQRWKKSE